MKKTSITCKELSRLASEALDRDLTLWERLTVKLHLWVCETCRYYVKHLRFLRRAAARAEQKSAPDAALSAEAKERMKQALRQKD